MDEDNSSGLKYILDEEEYGWSDSEVSNISDIENEANSGEGWSYISDPYSDTRDQALYEIENDYEMSASTVLAFLQNMLAGSRLLFSNEVLKRLMRCHQ